jgi:GAF domain-containing protein
MENHPREPLLQSAQDLAAMLRPGDLDATLEQITQAAVRLLPNVQYSSITVLTPDGLTTAAPTEERLLRLDEEQYQLREGPCFDAAQDESAAHIISANLPADERFPRYGPAAARQGIRSQVGLRLFDSGRSQGALNLYSTRVGAFEDITSLSTLFAGQAGQAIAFAYEITNLKEALQTRTVIGQATGIMMQRLGLSEERAFAFLKRLSSERNTKMRVLSQELVEAANRDAVTGG